MRFFNTLVLAIVYIGSAHALNLNALVNVDCPGSGGNGLAQTDCSGLVETEDWEVTTGLLGSTGGTRAETQGAGSVGEPLKQVMLLLDEELEDVHWVAFPDAKTLDLPIVTHFVLEELLRVQPPQPQPVRCFRARYGKMLVEDI